MIEALSSSPACGSSVPQAADQGNADEQSAEQKRLQCLALIRQPFPPSDADIARIVGVNRSTVGRYRKLLEEKGVEFAVVDGRVRSGRRRADLTPAWQRLEALKKQFPRYGGMELWAYLVGEEGWPEEELPSVSRINGHFSEKKMSNPHRTGKTDDRAYLAEGRDVPLGYVGMDSTNGDPLTTRSGTKFQVLDMRDWYTGAVYAEAFPCNMRTAYKQGMDADAYVGCYLRYVSHIGIPKCLVLDNGVGALTQAGWLPEVVRWAITYGTAVEYEPYGRPYKSGVIERWHRDLQKWWAGQRPFAEGGMQGAIDAVRARAYFCNKYWKRRHLGYRTASDVLGIRPWPTSGPDAGIRPMLPEHPIGRMGLQVPGFVRFQREVEQDGFVQLHGNDFFYVQPILTGSYVRVECHVLPGGMPGTGTVKDGKGNVVAEFTHFFECDRPQEMPLITNVKYQTYAGNEDCRNNWSQDAHNRDIERMMKNKRSKAVYDGTNSSPYVEG